MNKDSYGKTALEQSMYQVAKELKEQDCPMVYTAMVLSEIKTKKQCQLLLEYLKKIKNIDVDGKSAIEEMLSIIKRGTL